jgi:hypothetical protein
MIETFPEDRHFISSVLFILWGEDESETLPDDLRRMVCFPVKLYLLLALTRETGWRLRVEGHHKIPCNFLLVFENEGSGRKVYTSAEFDGFGHSWWAGGNPVPAR